MPNDNDGTKYRRLIDNATSRAAVNTPLMRALQYIARDMHEGGTTESTVAVGYWNAEWKHNRANSVTKILIGAAIAGVAFAVLRRKKDGFFEDEEMN